MNVKLARIALVVSALGLALNARAGFVNGGFETGDFTGWTLEYSSYGGPFQNLGTTPNGHQYIISNPYNDPYSPFDSPFNGNYMARLNEFSNPNGDISRISQTGVMNAGESDVYINWGAVMEDPGHPRSQQPYFDITILVNGVQVANENHNASDHTTGGWIAGTPNGPNYAQIYYSSGQFHIGGLNTGDAVTVTMTASDCMQGGHVGYAYLDGIGTVSEPPGGQVADGGMTALLLAPALLGLAALRRRS